MKHSLSVRPSSAKHRCSQMPGSLPPVEDYEKVDVQGLSSGKSAHLLGGCEKLLGFAFAASVKPQRQARLKIDPNKPI